MTTIKRILLTLTYLLLSLTEAVADAPYTSHFITELDIGKEKPLMYDPAHACFQPADQLRCNAYIVSAKPTAKTRAYSDSFTNGKRSRRTIHIPQNTNNILLILIHETPYQWMLNIPESSDVEVVILIGTTLSSVYYPADAIPPHVFQSTEMFKHGYISQTGIKSPDYNDIIDYISTLIPSLQIDGYLGDHNQEMPHIFFTDP